MKVMSWELEFVCPNCEKEVRVNGWSNYVGMVRCPSCEKEFEVE